MSYNIDIHYIFNSGFFVETDSCWLAFDYYMARRVVKNQNFDYATLEKRMLDSGKRIFVFASHSHFDHFSPRALNWDEENRDIEYILSDYIHIPNQKPNYHFVREGSKLSFGNISIDCFGSTDEGVSFLVNADGVNIFHAGDLNWWDWGNEDTEYEASSMETEYKRIIGTIKSANKNIDIMFFPLDARLEERYAKGAIYAIESLKPHIFIPMHFRKHPELTEEFKDLINKQNLETNILTIEHENSSFRV